MKVIGAGYGRTGTHSLKGALERLGFGPSYHMIEAVQNLEHVKQWSKAAHGEPVDWHALFEGFESATDWPSCTYWDRQLEAFPDAKVLLSIRDGNSWYESVSSTVSHMTGKNPRLVNAEELSARGPAQRAALLAGLAMLDEVVWDGTFHGRFDDREYAIGVFNQHIEDVKRRVPADQLLVFEVKQGWGPLCEFLNVPVPDLPFPHLSDRASMVDRLTKRGLI